MTFDDQTTGPATEPEEGYVHNAVYVLNELKRILFGQNTVFGDHAVVERRSQIDLSSEYRLSNQNDDFSAGVSHLPAESEYRIRANSGTEHLESLERLRYNAQYEAEIGVSLRVPEPPGDGQEVTWGYFDGTDGVYYGWDATGLYVERIRNGVEQGKVRTADWNGEPVDAAAALQDGVVAHIDATLYNNGTLDFQFHPRTADGRITPTTVHRMAPTGETTLTRQNQPIRVEVRNDNATDFDVFVADRAAAILGQTASTQRPKSHYRIGVSLSGTTWVPIFSVRKKAAFEGTPVSLVGLTVGASDDVAVQLRSDMALSNPSYGTPSNVDATETAVEVDEAATLTNDIDDGFQRWVDGFEGGSTQKPEFGAGQNLDAMLRNTRPMTLLARKLSGTGGTLNFVSLRWAEDW